MASDEPPRFILLLPPLPTPPTLATFKAAFGDTVSQVLKECASQSSSSTAGTVLEIAVACPDLVGQETAPRAALYNTAQTLLAAVYKLVCVIAVRDSINIEDSEGVDVRVLLVAWSPDSKDHATSSPLSGAVVDLPTLAASGRQWAYAFGVESDEGEAFVRAFVAAKQQLSSSEASTSSPATQVSSSTTAPPSTRHHHHVAVGGTFDHLHIGHKLLLHMTLFVLSASPSTPSTATIGITGDPLLAAKKHASYLESWTARQRRVQDFILAIAAFSPASPPTIISPRSDAPQPPRVDIALSGLEAHCVEILDAFGPTITEEQISALVVSGETRGGGAAVNARRKEMGWAELEVFEVDVLDAVEAGAEGGAAKEGFEGKISSTAIRAKLASATGTGTSAGGG